MKRFSGIAVAVVALAFAGVSVDAQAQSKPKPKPRAELVTPNPAAVANDWGPAARRRSLELNTDGRWGLKLDFEQPSTRDVQWRDVEAGAYFRVSPSLRVGGSVGLGGQSTPRRVTEDEKPQPRVRLETTFRF